METKTLMEITPEAGDLCYETWLCFFLFLLWIGSPEERAPGTTGFQELEPSLDQQGRWQIQSSITP